MNTRIKDVRKSQKLTQREFAERLKLSENFIHLVEKGERQISDRTLDDICREFNVNEAWLRTGEGEMFHPQTLDKQISDFLGDLLHDKPDFRHRFVKALAAMSPEEWELLERKIREICED